MGGIVEETKIKRQGFKQLLLSPKVDLLFVFQCCSVADLHKMFLPA